MPSCAGLGFLSPGHGPLALLSHVELLAPLAHHAGLGAALASGALGAPASVHVEARQWLLDGWALAHPGQPLPLGAAQFYQALAAHEGGPYGLGWTDKPNPLTGIQTSMQGSWNMGGIQCKDCPPNGGACCPGCGYWYDSRPTAGGQQYFEQCFKRYDSPAEGFAGLITFLDHYPQVIAAIPSNDLDEIAWKMRLGGYFWGFSPDKHVAAATYAGALDRQVKEIAAALGEERVARRLGGQSEPLDCGGECEGPAAGQDPAAGEGAPPGGLSLGDVALAGAGAAAAFLLARALL